MYEERFICFFLYGCYILFFFFFFFFGGGVVSIEGLFALNHMLFLLDNDLSFGMDMKSSTTSMHMP